MDAKRKKELLEVAKNYRYGIADGLIVSATRAVEVLEQHSNIIYIRFSNDVMSGQYDSLAEAYDDGVEIDYTAKFYA